MSRALLEYLSMRPRIGIKLQRYPHWGRDWSAYDEPMWSFGRLLFYMECPWMRD